MVKTPRLPWAASLNLWVAMPSLVAPSSNATRGYRADERPVRSVSWRPPPGKKDFSKRVVEILRPVVRHRLPLLPECALLTKTSTSCATTKGDDKLDTLGFFYFFFLSARDGK